MNKQVSGRAERAPTIKASAAMPLLALVTVAVQPLAAHAQRVVAPARSIASMDVAGVRLGMTKVAAQAAAATASYRCESFGREPSFDQKVQAEVERRRGGRPIVAGGSGTLQLNCSGPAGELLRIDFAQVRAGDVVEAVIFRADPSRVDRAAFRRQVEGKYGRPTVGTTAEGTWCDAGQRCATLFATQEGAKPKLAVSTQPGLQIAAFRGNDAKTADEMVVKAEAARQAPAGSSAAF